MIQTRKNDGPPKGRHGCYVSHALDGRIAETVGRTVSTFEPDLVRTQALREVDVEIWVKRQTPIFTNALGVVISPQEVLNDTPLLKCF